MTRELNRLNDVFFKYLLGDEKKKSLTLSFINGILNRTGNDLFTDLEFLDKEMTPITESGKVSVLDIRARMNDGSQVNIEVQVCKDPDMARRPAVPYTTGQEYTAAHFIKARPAAA